MRGRRARGTCARRPAGRTRLLSGHGLGHACLRVRTRPRHRIRYLGTPVSHTRGAGCRQGSTSRLSANTARSADVLVSGAQVGTQQRPLWATAEPAAGPRTAGALRLAPRAADGPPPVPERTSEAWGDGFWPAHPLHEGAVPSGSSLPLSCFVLNRNYRSPPFQDRGHGTQGVLENPAPTV